VVQWAFRALVEPPGVLVAGLPEPLAVIALGPTVSRRRHGLRGKGAMLAQRARQGAAVRPTQRPDADRGPWSSRPRAHSMEAADTPPKAQGIGGPYAATVPI
jgi:hypothetical protein